VAALVLVDTGPGFRNERAREAWNEMTERYAEDLEAKGLAGLPGSAELRSSVHQGARGLIHTARSTLRQQDGHVMERLGEIEVPALVVVGSLDEQFIPGSRYMAAKLPHAELVVIDGAGHAPTVTHPEEFNAALGTFLRALI
jgi:pimeloyl-ACP methyl ester carboxylesterase